MNDRLEVGLIRRGLEIGLRTGTTAPSQIGREILVVEEVGSTNDAIAEHAATGAGEGLVVVAETQTSGRGRKGAAWIAPPSHNLTFSVLLRPTFPIELWPRLSHVAGLAVVNGVEPWLSGIDLQLKWPNDVYADSKKLAGILVETRSSSSGAFVVLGIGLNVNSQPGDFPPELTHTLTSIAGLTGSPSANRSEVCGSILAELTRFYQTGSDAFETLIPQLERRSHLLHQTIRFRTPEGWNHTRMVGIGANGEMLVQDEPGGPVLSVLNAEEVRIA